MVFKTPMQVAIKTQYLLKKLNKLLALSVNSAPSHRDIKKVFGKINVNCRQVRSVWNQFKRSLEEKHVRLESGCKHHSKWKNVDTSEAEIKFRATLSALALLSRFAAPICA